MGQGSTRIDLSTDCMDTSKRMALFLILNGIFMDCSKYGQEMCI